jgi:hypothetical protein
MLHLEVGLDLLDVRELAPDVAFDTAASTASMVDSGRP